MNVAIIGETAGSGGLLALMRGVLNCDEIPSNINVYFFCSKNLHELLPDISNRINVIETGLFYDRSLKEKLTYSLQRDFIALVKSYNPDIVFYINGSLKKGLEEYRSIFLFNNQLYVDMKKLIALGLSKTTLTLLREAYYARKALRNADLVIFSSHFSKDGVEKSGIRIKDSAVISLSCSNVFRREGRCAYFAPGKEVIDLLYISSILPYKNQLPVLHATRRLHDDGFNVKLTLIGKNIAKNYAKKFYAYIDKFGMRDYIEHIEWVKYDDIPAIIDKCDIFINASSTDTCGTSVCEGMARGTVIAANNTSFNKDMLADAGEYFDINDEDTIYAALLKLIENPELRDEYANKGYELSRKYTLDDTAKAYYSLFIKDKSGI
ncbi:hypothetical protein JT05_06700 [Desulfosporosinus sp. Tol-M]|nr:hypothetical protein JT05_06700 [Desulfosporosinus sp. Tol-M]